MRIFWIINLTVIVTLCWCLLFFNLYKDNAYQENLQKLDVIRDEKEVVTGRRIEETPPRPRTDAARAALQQIHCKSDKIRESKVFSRAGSKVTIEQFYQTVMDTFQSLCGTIKRVGRGYWWRSGFDGHKYVCMDDLVRREEPCLVFSFGIGGEVTFEKEMMAMGCTIHGYDHTIKDVDRKRQENTQKGFFIHDKGIGTSKTDKLTTLEDEMEKLGWADKNVTYIKMDVEGAELQILPHWIKTGILKNVKQIGLEIHWVGQKNLQVNWEIIEGLYKQGFRLMTWEPNYGANLFKSFSKTSYFHIVYEVTFRKVDADACR